MRFLIGTILCGFALSAAAQSSGKPGILPDAPKPNLMMASVNGSDSALPASIPATSTDPSSQAGASSSSSPDQTKNQTKNPGTDKAASKADAEATIPAHEKQPKRILGMMPNYRAVSAGVRPPPPNAKESFKIATENNFDYSQYVFVGLTSLMAEGTNTHPEFGKGVGGYWSYYWRGYIDKSDGDYLIIFLFPTLFHEDERYFAMGQGPLWKRAVYSGASVFITPDYHGRNTFNWAEVLGRGVSQAVSLTYYPSSVATPASYSSKLGYAIGRDALTNVFREFYPDMAHAISRPFHRKAKQQQN